MSLCMFEDQIYENQRKIFKIEAGEVEPHETFCIVKSKTCVVRDGHDI